MLIVKLEQSGTKVKWTQTRTPLPRTVGTLDPSVCSFSVFSPTPSRIFLCGSYLWVTLCLVPEQNHWLSKADQGGILSLICQSPTRWQASRFVTSNSTVLILMIPAPYPSLTHHGSGFAIKGNHIMSQEAMEQEVLVIVFHDNFLVTNECSLVIIFYLKVSCKGLNHFLLGSICVLVVPIYTSVYIGWKSMLG